MNETKLLHIPDCEFQEFESRKRANFINSLSGMKSCNLIGTIDTEGAINLSIVSSAFHLGANPALIGFIIRPDSVPRHTLENMRATKACTLNHVNSHIYKKAHQTSARYHKDISEFEACGLTPEYSNTFNAPFVKESNIKLALNLVREVPIEENGSHMLICRIVDVYLPHESMLDNGHVEIEKADTICVSGLNQYHRTTTLSRLQYAKP